MTGPHSQGRNERPASSHIMTQEGHEGCKAPRTYRNIDHLVPPSLHLHSAHDGPPRQTPHSQASTASDDYGVPDSYVNLDEVADVSPIQNPHEDPIHGYESLEEVRSRDQERIRLEKSRSRQKRESIGAKEKKARVSKLTTQIYTSSYLILFSILGTLARLGLTALVGNYPGAPVIFPSLWSNFAGSLVMGFLAEDRKIFRHASGNCSPASPLPSGQDDQQTRTSIKADEQAGGFNNTSPDQHQHDPSTATATLQAERKAHTALKKTIPLYVGLATGFCGSFTSFSSFLRDVFLSLSNDLAPYPPSTPPSTIPRSPGYSLASVLATILITTSLSLSALFLGAHISIACEPYLPSLPPPSRSRVTRTFLDRSAVFLGLSGWLTVIFLSAFPPSDNARGMILFALALSPLGTLLRFFLSTRLNGRIARFPLGTFAANILGTAVLGVAWDVAHLPSTGSVVSCQVLQGIQDGFCGCLTTVSTWVAELAALRRQNAYVYGVASVGVGLGFLVAVMGGLRWAGNLNGGQGGWGEVRCVTGFHV